MKPAGSGSRVDLYGASYGNFATELYADIRREAFGEDIGQTSWLTAEEQDLFIDWLGLNKSSHLLDVACGSGKPTLRIGRKTGCRISGIDLHAEAIANAEASARGSGMEQRATFHQGNATERLPFEDSTFDALTCIDAINHLPNRTKVLLEWRRVVKPGARVLFTDPIVVTGLITNAEIATRASIGLFVFGPTGLNDQLLEKAGFEVERVEDRTPNMAQNASGWLDARSKREVDLRAIEGDDTFAGQQRFLEMAARLRRSGDSRVSRSSLGGVSSDQLSLHAAARR